MRPASLVLLASLALWIGCAEPPASKPTLVVSAASDLTNAFREIGAAFERDHVVRVDFNFGSSGNLAQQIEQGARVDVFASANVSFVDKLEEKNLIVPGTKALYARGRLVGWQRNDAALPIRELADLAKPEIRRFSLANPDHAPYGTAAKQALESLGLWESLQDKRVIGENVRQAFQYAETGNVDVGLVALPMCRPGQGRWILVPEEMHQPLDQALAVVASSLHVEEAKQFAAFVNGPQGRSVLRRYGLVLSGETLPPELLGAESAGEAPAPAENRAPMKVSTK